MALLFFTIVIAGGIFLITSNKLPVAKENTCAKPSTQTWATQSIDTMKYSRDHADEHMKDKNFMETLIPQQVATIKSTGVTHVAINTAYDKEFRPMLEAWIDAVRAEDLKVFFRGNWASWEGWFKYPKNLTREDHIKKTKQFILDNSNFFEEGDIFSACMECENGGPGDPRQIKDASGHRKFLISEYNAVSEAFDEIGKKVEVANFAMNGDVAELIMDKTTTRALGGVITVDHYIKTPERLDSDLKKYAKKSGGKIFVGELGVPLDGIHGYMSEDQQAKWVDEALGLLMKNKNVIGINYWVNMKGSTALWNTDGTPRKVVDVLTKYYKQKVIYGRVLDSLDMPIEKAKITVGCQKVFTDKDGCFSVKYIPTSESCSKDTDVNISKEKYKGIKIKNNNSELIEQSMELKEETFKFKMQRFVRKLQKKF